LYLTTKCAGGGVVRSKKTACFDWRAALAAFVGKIKGVGQRVRTVSDTIERKPFIEAIMFVGGLQSFQKRYIYIYAYSL